MKSTEQSVNIKTASEALKILVKILSREEKEKGDWVGVGAVHVHCTRIIKIVIITIIAIRLLPTDHEMCEMIIFNIDHGVGRNVRAHLLATKDNANLVNEVLQSYLVFCKQYSYEKKCIHVSMCVS